MIDLHFHCLPGIDDGPTEWDAAVELCKQAGEEGTTHIVATPHVLRDRWINDDTAARDELLLKLNDLVGGQPAILPGCEYFFSADAIDLWERGSHGPLYGLNRSRYLLVEFPATAIPRDAEHVLYEFKFIDVVPVIAHPERNLQFARDPELLAHFVDLGAITQITAASVTGEFGKAALLATEDFLARGLVHIVASDAHNLDRRPPRLAAAYARAKELWGTEIAEAIFIANPAAVIANESLVARGL
jgi:protein-tyrosine phosphatase